MSIGEDKNKPDWKCIKEFLLKEGPLRKDQVLKLLRDAIAVLSKISTVVLTVMFR